MLEERTPVAGYIRVSTQDQAEYGNGLAVQEEQVRAYCAERGFHLVRIYREEGVSGTNGMEGRIALPLLVADLSKGEFEAAVVVRLDRLARDLILQETIIADLRKRNGVIISVTEPDLCGDDPGRKLIRRMLGTIAEYEKDLITARLTGGRRRKKIGGGFTGEWLPLGYQTKGFRRNARVVVEAFEAEIVKRVFAEYEAGRSMRDIARGLIRDRAKTKRGGSWTQAHVGVILRNEAYVDGQYPPIIDRVQWAACTRRRHSYFKRNREKPEEGEEA